VRFTLEGGSATTTIPGGSVITIYGGPNATANIPGPHNDPADLYGIVLVLAVIFVSIALARWVFGRRGKAGPRPS
jgi:hypothetical protein